MRIVFLLLFLFVTSILLGEQIISNASIEQDEMNAHSSHGHDGIAVTDLVEDYGLQIGDKAPDFTLKTLDGKTLSLKDLQGKKILLNFWASWCSPCKQEMPHMQKVYEQYQDKNVEIVAVNLTFGDESIEDVKHFADKYGLTFPIPLDTLAEVQEIYQIYPIPTSYFIDTEGYIRSKYLGPMDEEYIIHELNKL